jgi:zinc protease
MAKVKETYLVKRKEDAKTNNFWISNLLTASQENKNPENILDYESRVNNLKPEDLQEIAKKYLDENYFLGILMPETN